MNTFKVPLIIIGLLLFAAGGVWAFQGKDVAVRDYKEGEILVKYRPGITERDRGRSRGLVRANKTRMYRHIGIEKLSLGVGLSAVEAVDLLNSDPNVEYAELNYLVQYLDAPRIEPNDTGYTTGDQWYLDAPFIAGSHVGTAGTVFIDRDIDAPEAWAVMVAVFDTTMAASVGVLDSGCGESGLANPATGYQPGHEDIPNSSLWLNPAELGNPGTDSTSDPNTFIDDVNGWDFIEDDNNMADVFDTRAPYHGTHISGIVAGQWSNGVGVAGIGRGQLKVLPLRTATSIDIAAAIDYAIETSGSPQVAVLNASWKFTFPIQSLQDAIVAASDAGIAFVAAAGNDGNNNDISTGVNRVYPAQYTKVPLTNLLAVAATGRDGSLAWFSNYGLESVQIAAPGVSIYSPSGGTNGYTFVNGTSFSAPIAASVLALVMAANPALSPAEAIDRVIDGGDFDARLSGRIQSGKRINLAGAMAPFAPYSDPAPMDTLIPVSLYADTVSALYGSISNAISDSPSVAVMVTTSGGSWAISPVSPGLTTFNLEFDGISAPVGTYGTGLWRVTGISPFSAQIDAGQSMLFSSLISGTIDWRVNNSIVGTIDSSGLFTALSSGITQVVLTVDGQDVDNTGTILVIALDNDVDGYRGDVDCDDTDPDINPGEAEVCSDSIDNDCDGDVDRQDSQCSSSSDGGCGMTSLPPGEPMWPVIVVLGGMMLMLVRRRYRVALSAECRETGSKVQIERKCLKGN
jgi:subtilisin family serine protease